MNYEETIEKIHGFRNSAADWGLERMTVLMDLLGNPQDQIGNSRGPHQRKRLRLPLSGFCVEGKRL